jgi:glycosyltransferase involved in cell wall biosynthesis
MKICIVYNPKPNGISLYRQELPNGHICENYPDLFEYVATDTESIKQVSEGDLDSIDLFLYSRLWYHPVDQKTGEVDFSLIGKYANELRKNGAKIVLDIDDWWNLTQNHPFYDQWCKWQTGEVVKEHIRLADVVTTTHQYLADKIRHLNKNVVILENAPWTKYEQFVSQKTKSEVIRFGYFGASQHFEDVDTLELPFRKLAQNSQLDGKYLFMLGGWREDNDASQFYQHIFSAGGLNKNFGRIAMADIYSFAQGYNDVDVSIAPLHDTEFNKCKSNLKIIEAGYHKCAFVGTDIIPYSGHIRQGDDGYLIPADKPKEWYGVLRDMINNPDRTREMGQRLYDRITSEVNLDEINLRRIELYKSLKRGI